MVDRLEAIASGARERRALLYGLASVALWSTSATGFKLGLRELAPVQLLLLGCAVALLGFAVARRFATATLSWRRHIAAAALGMVNPLIYYVLLFEAYSRLPAQIAQPLNYTWALTLALLAIPLLRQRLSVYGWCGALIGYAGAIVVLTRGELADFQRFDTLGVLLALFSTLLWALYWIALIRLRIPPAVTMFNGFAVATPLAALLCHATVGLPPLTVESVGYGAWVGLVEFFGAFLLWQRALALTAKVGRMSQLVFLAPFLSLVPVWLVLGEQIHPSAVVGLALIVGGVALSRR